jgi:6-phosphofructokinase
MTCCAFAARRCSYRAERAARKTLASVAGDKVAHQLEALTGKEARTVVLGHLLRGGSPTSFDRLVALHFGAAAVRARRGPVGGDGLAESANRALQPLKEAVKRMKTVPLDSDTVDTAHDPGISFGD